MYGLILLVVVALVSLLITRVATVALTVTGMARESARFQARSALSGVGFTTNEAEMVVNHPVRRRIVMALMLLGNVGIATAIAGILATFAGSEPRSAALRASVLVGALAAVYAASRSPAVDRRLSRLIALYLRRYTRLETRDYERLLHLAGDYSVQELAIEPSHWLAGQTLGHARLRDEGILILGITRSDGSYVGVPGRDTVVCGGDTLILYGRGASVERLDRRAGGVSAVRDRAEAVLEQRVVEQEAAAADPGTPSGDADPA